MSKKKVPYEDTVNAMAKTHPMAPRAIQRSPDTISGFALKNSESYVGRDGLWTLNPQHALRFYTAEDAAGYNSLHCESAYEVVEGA